MIGVIDTAPLTEIGDQVRVVMKNVLSGLWATGLDDQFRLAGSSHATHGQQRHAFSVTAQPNEIEYVAGQIWELILKESHRGHQLYEIRGAVTGKATWSPDSSGSSTSNTIFHHGGEAKLWRLEQHPAVPRWFRIRPEGDQEGRFQWSHQNSRKGEPLTLQPLGLDRAQGWWKLYNMDTIDRVEGGLHFHVKIKNVSTGLYARVAPSYNTDTLFAESDDSFKIWKVTRVAAPGAGGSSDEGSPRLQLVQKLESTYFTFLNIGPNPNKFASYDEFSASSELQTLGVSVERQSLWKVTFDKDEDAFKISPKGDKEDLFYWTHTPAYFAGSSEGTPITLQRYKGKASLWQFEYLKV